jgi:hypothetical protein
MVSLPLTRQHRFVIRRVSEAKGHAALCPQIVSDVIERRSDKDKEGRSKWRSME